ncbi:MAG: hypothetical protein WAO98_07800 [Alphaproteobacteria bacterium]
MSRYTELQYAGDSGTSCISKGQDCGDGGSDGIQPTRPELYLRVSAGPHYTPGDGGTRI